MKLSLSLVLTASLFPLVAPSAQGVRPTGGGAAAEPSRLMTLVAENPTRPVINEELVVSWQREFLAGESTNGDADLLDEVLQVYVRSTGEMRNIGLANPGGTNSSFWIEVSGSRVLFVVGEEEQDQTDLNGDGDTDDQVLHAYDASGDRVVNLGFAIDSDGDFKLTGDLFGCWVPELEQGATDLNGDGDTSDMVLVWGDLSTGATTVTTVSQWFLATLTAENSMLVTAAREASYFETGAGGLDLNGDGDFDDQVPVIVRAGTLTMLPVASITSIQVMGPKLMYYADEARQGADYNGDGDMLDFVPQVYDPVSAQTTNTGVASLAVAAAEGVLAISVDEEDHGGVDLNGDGDATDKVAHVWEDDSSTLINLGYAIVDYRIKIDGRRIGFLVDEFDHEGGSFNSDTDEGDVVLFVYDRKKGVFHNTGAHCNGTFELLGPSVVFYTWEAYEGRLDLNGDGDWFDTVVTTFRYINGVPQNTGLSPVDNLFGNNGAGIFSISEEVHQVDFNGDGDFDDPVAMTFDGRTGQLRNLEQATGHLTGGTLRGGRSLPVFVSEFRQGEVDINGDGDATDAHLYLYR